MKIAITGHSAGIGQALAEAYVGLISAIKPVYIDRLNQ